MSDTQISPVVKVERFPPWSFLKKWIGPAIVLGLGVGSLAGAIDYRFSVPVVTTQGADKRVTQTVTLPAPPPETAVETKTITANPVTVTVTAPPRPAETVVITKTAEPERVEVEKPTRRETITETETTTVGIGEQIRNIRQRGQGNG
jgi:hypothetical protein